MNTFEDLQRLRGDRWRHCQLNNLKVPVFQTFILPKVVCHRIEKKDYCHLLVEKGRWIFAQWKSQAQCIFSVPHLALHPASWDPEIALGKGGMMLPSSFSGRESGLSFWVLLTQFMMASGGNVGRICEDKHWQASSRSASVYPSRWSHCLPSPTGTLSSRIQCPHILT